MGTCFFVSDLHGHISRYRQLFEAIAKEQPDAVFLGGDLFPSGNNSIVAYESFPGNFVNEFLAANFQQLKDKLEDNFPRVFLILGNDDSSALENDLVRWELGGLWEYIHGKLVLFGDYMVVGYAFVPPTPFLLKDWERYDISQRIDPGCVPPEDGWHSNSMPKNKISFSTIQQDLTRLLKGVDLSRAILLFHTPPYQTNLDRAQLDGKLIDHVPLDVNVGSIAVKQLIESRQPLISLHGHVHESTRLTGSWKDQIGRTYALSAAHDGPDLALIRFDPDSPDTATRELI